MPLVVGAALVSVALATAVAVVTGRDDPRPVATEARPAAAAAPDPAGSAAGSPAPSTSAPPATGPADSAPPSPTASEPSQSPAVVAATAAGRTPEAARVALEQVLAARALGHTALLRAVLADDDPAVGETQRSLDASGDDLQAVVTAWGGADLAAQVRTGLDRQTAASRAYAEAVREGDTAAAERARGEMGSLSRELGGTLDRVTGGGIAPYVPPQDAGRLRAFVDALAAGNAADAAEHERWLQARLTREGTALARGLAQPR